MESVGIVTAGKALRLATSDRTSGKTLARRDHGEHPSYSRIPANELLVPDAVYAVYRTSIGGSSAPVTAPSAHHANPPTFSEVHLPYGDVIGIELNRYTGEALLSEVRAQRAELAEGALYLWFTSKKLQTGGNRWTRLRNTVGPINWHGFTYRVSGDSREAQLGAHELTPATHEDGALRTPPVGNILTAASH